MNNNTIHKKHNVCTFLLRLLSIAFVVMAGCDEPNSGDVTGSNKSMITEHPASGMHAEGAIALLNVVATAPTGTTLSYQWQKASKGSTDFASVAEATSDSYATPELAYADSGVQYRVVVTATSAVTKKVRRSEVSKIATLLVRSIPMVAPVITQYPSSQTVLVGSTATLSVEATAPTGATLSYQWQTAPKGSTSFTDIEEGATGNSYTTPTLGTNDNGTQYRVVVTATKAPNRTSRTTSNIATITVSTTPPPAAPVITTPPASQTVTVGNTATLSVVATAAEGAKLSYQWQAAPKGSTSFTDIAGATSATYTTATLSIADNGTQYKVVVSATNAENITNTATSSVATITVSEVLSPNQTSKIVWTHIDGTKKYSDVPEDGILLSFVLAGNGKVIKSVDAIPNSVTSIGEMAFYNCSGLESITIPESVTSIGSEAFYGCSSLASVTIPNKVTSIESSTFRGCGALKSVTIPNSVTSIGEMAFYGCSSLASVTIPNKVTSIESSTFRDCSGLKSVTIPNSVTSIGKEAFNGCSGLTSITIPNSVTSIGSNTFRGCSGLKSVTIPNSVKNIGEAAFSNCSGLKSITIGDGVTSIGNQVFLGCSGLESVTIPNSVASIGTAAFSYCSGLKSVTIPNSVTSIGNEAFNDCRGLTSITIPNSVTSIGELTFSGCRGLTGITIPNSVTSIEGKAFYDCSSLTSVTLPNSLTSIGGYAFADCSDIASITIPSSVTNIGERAFYGCYTLAKVKVEATSPPTAGSDMFLSASPNLGITVPNASVKKYKAAEGWRQYEKQITGN